MNSNSTIDERALFTISAGLYVVTSYGNGKFNGMISNSVTQVTAEPLRVAVSINKDNFSHQLITASNAFAFTILSQEVTMDHIGIFGFNSGKDQNKLEGIAYETGQTGCPLILNYGVSCVEANIFSKVDVGTHTTFFGDVVSAKVISEKPPLTYEDYHKVKKGITPKNAPTYRGEQMESASPQDTATSLFKCSVCGYEYDQTHGDRPRCISRDTF